jgi:hypothetical protein
VHAVFVEVEMQQPVSETSMAEAREGLSQTAVPRAREAGASAAYWFGSLGALEGHALIVFDDEASARKMVEQMPRVGEEGGSGATIRRIDVREVLTSL